jgi:hypothetical protein
MVCGPDEGEYRGLAAQLHVGCTEGRCLHLEDYIRFDCAATLFAVERVTGIEPALSAWELFEPMGVCLVLCEFRGLERPRVSLGCPP